MREALIISSFLTVTPVFAQDIPFPTTVEAQLPGLAEDLRASPAISGARIVGVVRDDTSGSPTQPEFFIRVPGDWTEHTVCLRVTSVDALYEATAGYVITQENADKTVSLEFKTKRHQFWNAIAAREDRDSISALATRGSCDTPREAALAIPVEIGDLSTSGDVSIFLNTFRSEAAFIEWGGQEVDCEVVDVAVRTAFDMRCTIDLSSTNAEEVELTIYPIRAGEIGQPMTTRLIP